MLSGTEEGLADITAEQAQQPWEAGLSMKWKNKLDLPALFLSPSIVNSQLILDGQRQQPHSESQ